MDIWAWYENIWQQGELWLVMKVYSELVVFGTPREREYPTEKSIFLRFLQQKTKFYEF